jgi:hypothetical protein
MLFDSLFLLAGPTGTAAMLFVALAVFGGVCSLGALGHRAQRSS